MKALTILQPWASLIACGAKRIETRSWATKYRGPLAIHAGKSLKAWHMNIAWKEPFYSALASQHNTIDDKASIRYPMPGSIIAIADLVDCVKILGYFGAMEGGKRINFASLENGMRVMGQEECFGDYEEGRYAWILDNVRQIEPVPAKGMQGLWNWNEVQI